MMRLKISGAAYIAIDLKYLYLKLLAMTKLK